MRYLHAFILSLLVIRNDTLVVEYCIGILSKYLLIDHLLMQYDWIPASLSTIVDTIRTSCMGLSPRKDGSNCLRRLRGPS